MANLLIVDDKEQILDPFQYHFESIKWHVEVARDGLEAIAILEEKGRFFDATLLDKNMPGASGDQVVKWLYEHELLDDICVVLLTGFPEMQSAIDALRMGVWQYLIKDMTPTEIQTFIAPGIALKKVHRMRRELWDEKDLTTVLDQIQNVVRETLAPDLFHVIFLSTFLSRDLSDGSSPSADRAFVKRIAEGKRFISVRTRDEVASMEPVLPDAGTLMAVPVDHDHKVLGVLEMESLKEEAFDPRWKDVLTYFAELISLTQAIHDQRLLVEEKAKQADLARTNSELHHRIANSLGIIQQSARDLESEDLPNSARQRVGYIAAHSSRIKNVLVELKDLSTPRPVKAENIDIGRVVRGVTEEWLTYSPDVMVSLSPARKVFRARADEERLRETVSCLVKNALEAIEERQPKDKYEDSMAPKAPKDAQAEAQPPRYWVRVEISEDDALVNVAISDNGIGFDEDIRARLFNPLFSTKSRRDNLNQGFGLYTSERVVKAMGGSITASSKGPYEGATFTIRLMKNGE